MVNNENAHYTKSLTSPKLKLSQNLTGVYILVWRTCKEFCVNGVRFQKFGNLSSNMALNRFSTIFRSFIGIVHFFEMLVKAK
jgi:hypothetical protein